MKKVTSIFQLLLALFFGVALVFFLAFDSVRNGFGIQELTAGNVVVWLLVGLVLFLVSWFFQTMYTNSLNRKIKKLELERNEIKAKLYDLDEGGKFSEDDSSKPGQEEDKESSVIKPRQNFK